MDIQTEDGMRGQIVLVNGGSSRSLSHAAGEHVATRRRGRGIEPLSKPPSSLCSFHPSPLLVRRGRQLRRGVAGHGAAAAGA